MIVKIWPVKGTKGVKHTLLYIQDDNKVVEIETNEDGSVTRRTVIDTRAAANTDASKYFIDNEANIDRVMGYIGEEEKIKSKFISGYLCDPKTASEEFNHARLITCHNANKPVKDGAKDIVAFHIVQSFPQDLDISDEEVHQCGIELVERLGKHQAVIASHVHPVTDEDGIEHGKAKHNHIVINAYVHPDHMDKDNPKRIRYHSGKDDYALLRFWNDEIAMEHGLPIIRNPDMERTYSWYEAEMEKKKMSWKGRVRTDIDEAKRVTNNWNEFVHLMEDNGYQILERGDTVTFLTPDNAHKVRGKTLGRNYSKNGLEAYWSLREETKQDIQRYVEMNQDLSLWDLVRTKTGLTVAVPLGNEGMEKKQYHHLKLDRKDLSDQALNTYFRKKQQYDICDLEGNSIFSVSGSTLLAYYKDLRNGLEKSGKSFEEGQKQNTKEESSDYYCKEEFRNSQTNEPYKVPKKDKNGGEIPPLRLIFLLACIILRKEDGRWTAKKIAKEKANEPIFGRTDWKIQNMLDSIAVAREENLNTPAEIDTKLQQVGANYSRIRSSLNRTTAAKQSMKPLMDAIENYKETAKSAETILAMPKGEARTLAEQEHAAALVLYKNSRATMYRHGVKMPEQIADVESRYKNILANMEDLQAKCDAEKESYRRLKKLKYNTELAQNAQYIYGPAYEAGHVFGGGSSGGGGNRKAKDIERETGKR